MFVGFGVRKVICDFGEISFFGMWRKKVDWSRLRNNK